MTVYLLAVVLPAAALVAVIPYWLLRAGYSGRFVVVLTMLTFLQAGTVMALARPGQSLWFALGIAALAASASAFAEREDLRRVILFGGSLAAVQFCDPSGALVAAGMLPATFALGAPREARKATGLFAMLLFMPIIAGGLLLYLSHVGYRFMPPAAWVPVPHVMTSTNVAMAIIPAFIVAPALWIARRTRAGRASFYVVAATVFAMAIVALNGGIREPAMLLSVAVPITVVAMAALPASPRRERCALFVAGTCAVLSWVAFIFASG